MEENLNFQDAGKSLKYKSNKEEHSDINQKDNSCDSNLNQRNISIDLPNKVLPNTKQKQEVEKKGKDNSIIENKDIEISLRLSVDERRSIDKGGNNSVNLNNSKINGCFSENHDNKSESIAIPSMTNTEKMRYYYYLNSTFFYL